MLWLWLALVPAVTVALRDVSIKIYEDLSPLEVAGIELFWSLPLLVFGCVWVEIPTLDVSFWWAFLLSFPLNIAAYLLYLHALKWSPVSLSVPFLAFTPVFMMATGLLVLGESVSLWGALGISLIVVGGYVLHLRGNGEGVLQPFRSFVLERGSWCMLVVAVLFSLAAVVGKKAMLHSSPLFFSYFFFLGFNLLILAGLILQRKSSVQRMVGDWRRGLWLGGLLFLHISFHGLAIILAKAVYMVAVKRSSILFTVLLSWILLGEGHRFSRGLGTLCMFLGVVLISLYG